MAGDVVLSALTAGIAVTAGFRRNSIAAVVPHRDGQKILLKADALIADQRTWLEIAITTDLAQAMALVEYFSATQRRHAPRKNSSATAG